MIEKLKNIPLDMNGKPSAVWTKINELVDAVNTIQKEREAERFEIQEWIGILEAVRKSVNTHEKQIDELQMKAEPEKCKTPTENVQPDYAITYMSDGHIKKFYGHDSIVELECPLPQGTKITIRSIAKGGDNE